MENHKLQHCKNFPETFEQSPNLFSCFNELEPYKCRMCGTELYFKFNFIKHLKHGHESRNNDFVDWVEEEPDTLYNCYKCKFGTLSRVVLMKHETSCKEIVIKNEHIEPETSQLQQIELKSINIKYTNLENIKWLNCKQCLYITVKADNLKKHIKLRHKQKKNHANAEEKRFRCEKCPFRTNWSQSLQGHQRRKHTVSMNINFFEDIATDCGDDKRFKCDECLFKTKWKGSLNMHKLSKHTASQYINWYKCVQCSFKAIQKGNLKVHIQSKHLDFEDKLL